MSANSYLLVLVFICVCVICCAGEENGVTDKRKGMEFVGRMLEEGRTLVHHAVKRFMIILPAIFFKLGIAFTLLVLVTIVAINNGFIGFLLLVVGLSSVLARLQEARRPVAGPYITPLASHYHQAHILDRSDTVGEKTDNSGLATNYQYHSNNRPYSGYGQAYYGTKSVKK